MTRSKQKGTAAETAVVRFLRDVMGFAHVERRTLTGARDRGDIAGLPGVCIEVKNCATMQLGEWLNEAIEEGRNANATTAVVWHKRRGRADAGEWYVTMTGRQFAELLAQVQA